jgi:hypothetical protein
MRFHDDCIRNVRKAWNANVGCGHLVVIGIDVVRNVALSELNSFENRNELLRLLANFVVNEFDC